MRRYDKTARMFVDDPRADDFLAEIVSVCRKHWRVIREDNSGFLVEPITEVSIALIEDANIATRI